MLLTNFVQEIFFKLFALIMSLIYSISGPMVPPSTENPIKPLDAANANLVFAALADPQISNYMFDRYEVYEGAMMDLHASERMDAVLLAGDIAENGLAEEYQLVYDGLAGIEGCRYICSTGNHDIRLRAFGQSMDRFYAFAQTGTLTSTEATFQMAVSMAVTKVKDKFKRIKEHVLYLIKS